MNAGIKSTVSVLNGLLIAVVSATAQAVPMQFSANGHYYDFIPKQPDGIAWDDARQEAETLTFDPGRGPLQGYLATITSQEENDFLDTVNSVDGGWLGGSDDAVEGEWRWVTGPEAGTLFWLGDANGTVQNCIFANWAVDEPNNINLSVNQPENFLARLSGNEPQQIGPRGEWNDEVAVREGYWIEYAVDTSPGPTTLCFTATTFTADEGAANATITVDRLGDSTNSVTVDFASSDGSATAPADYTAASGQLSFVAGSTSQTFNVAVVDDSDAEPDETVNLALSNATAASGNVMIGSSRANAALTITDNDGGGGGGGGSGGGGGGSLSPAVLIAGLLLLFRRRWQLSCFACAT